MPWKRRCYQDAKANLGRARIALGWCAVLVAGCAGSPRTAPPSPLRVGTVDEYPPYSVAAGAGYVGVDIDLARDLGRQLGRPVEFVGTSWRTLLADAIAGRFDLAMSAIEILPSRQEYVDFSIPYGTEHRVVVVRCSELDRFSELDDLNQPAVAVFVLAAAASAIYTLTRLPEARVRQVERLTAAYESLVAGNGDAVVATGTRWHRYRDLCLGLQQQRFHENPIAVLLPKDSALTPTVNGWLSQRLSDGTVGRVMAHYGAR